MYCTVSRSYSLSEKAAETISSQAPTADHPPLLFPGIRHASTSISSSHPPSSHVANTPPVAGCVRHSTTPLCLSCLGRSDCASRAVDPFHLDLDEPRRLATGLGVSPRPARRDTLERLHWPSRSTSRLFLRLYEPWIPSSRPRTSTSPVRRIPTVLRPLEVMLIKRRAFQEGADDLVMRLPAMQDHFYPPSGLANRSITPPHISTVDHNAVSAR
jgi:hypothetical protein